jgi:hypothetical protein
VEENHGVSVIVMRMDFPGAESSAVGSDDGDVLEIGVGRLSGLAKFRSFGFCEWASRWVEGGIGQVDAAEGAEGEVKEYGEEKPTGAARDGHGLREGTEVGIGMFHVIGRRWLV